MAELNKVALLKAIDRAVAAGDQTAARNMLALLPNPADSQSGSIDSSSGAGIGTRMVVGNARNPTDRLAAMQNHYPEARPYGEDGDNFIFNSRQTGQPTLYNPPGMMPELGDFAEYGRIGSEVIAGISAVVPSSVSGPLAIPVGAAAASTAGLLYDEAINQFGGVDGRDAGQRTVDTGTEFLLNMVPFDKALGVAKDFVSPRLRQLMTTSNQAVIDVANKYNIKPTAGVMGNKMMAGLDAMTQKAWGGIETWQRSADEMMEGVGKMLEDFHLSLGGKANPESAGQQVVNAAKKYQEAFKVSSKTLYDEAAAFIPTGARVPAIKTRDFINAYRDRFKNDPEIGKLLNDKTLGALSEVPTLAEQSMNPNLAYTTLRSLRTMIGGKLDDGDKIGDLNSGEMKQLYKALTEDIFAGAADFGDDALFAARAANDHYSAGSIILEDIVENYMMTGANKWATGTEAFGAFKRLANDPEQLAKVQGAGVLSETDLNQMGSALLEDVGMAAKSGQNAPADRVSPGRIISQTDKSVIPMGSQDILFNGSAKEIIKDMRVFSESVKDVEKLVNNSNSGTHLSTIQGVQAISTLAATAFTTGGTTLTALLPVASAYATSKGLASDRLKKWMLNAPTDASKKAMAEWKKTGFRIAAAQGVTPFVQAIFDMSDGENGKAKGALAE
tara:strand:+ start:855 stop:2867 length:2013 start_codon:yes stop_codon:yes gene_type:complete